MTVFSNINQVSQFLLPASAQKDVKPKNVSFFARKKAWLSHRFNLALTRCNNWFDSKPQVFDPKNFITMSTQIKDTESNILKEIEEFCLLPSITDILATKVSSFSETPSTKASSSFTDTDATDTPPLTETRDQFNALITEIHNSLDSRPTLEYLKLLACKLERPYRVPSKIVRDAIKTYKPSSMVVIDTLLLYNFNDTQLPQVTPTELLNLVEITALPTMLFSEYPHTDKIIADNTVIIGRITELLKSPTTPYITQLALFLYRSDLKHHRIKTVVINKALDSTKRKNAKIEREIKETFEYLDLQNKLTDSIAMGGIKESQALNLRSLKTS